LNDRHKLDQKRRYLARHMGGDSQPQSRLDKIDSLVDEKIREAQAEGAFDNLPGFGKPLPRDRDQDVAGESWMSNRVLKQAGFVPEWVRLRKEIADERPKVAEALRAYRAARRTDGTGSEADLEKLEKHYIALAVAINQKIDAHNGQCPPGQILTRFVEDATRRWG
jgi:DnaJ homolog subfamily C member 28